MHHVQKDQRTGIWVKRSYSIFSIVIIAFAATLSAGMIMLRSECESWTEGYQKYGNITYYCGIALASLAAVTFVMCVIMLAFEKTFWHVPLRDSADDPDTYEELPEIVKRSNRHQHAAFD